MWSRVRFELSRLDLVEWLTAELWEMGAAGCEVRDGETFSEFADSTFSVPAGGAVEVIAYFPRGEEPVSFEPISDRFPGLRIIGAQPFDDASWSESWRQYFTPTRVSPRIVVRPSWNVDLPDDEPAVVLVVDPGMAFGTGTHETTRMCLQAIDEHLRERPGSSFLDVGCGSGILSMAAAQLGAGHVLGLDNDPDAILVARENWQRNDLGRAEEAPFVTTPLGEIDGRFDLVVANMLSGILDRLRDDLMRVTARGGRLVVSGILESELAGFAGRFASPPVEIERRVVVDGWSALWCVVKR